MTEKFCLLTNDVETTSIWHNALRDETGWKVFEEGLPILLNIYKKYKIKSTFFITGHIAQLIPDLVRMIHYHGHEIGCHGLTHQPHLAFDKLNLNQQIDHLTKAKIILEDIVGDKVISFRAPSARVQPVTAYALQETGFTIDSSISSQRFDMFLTFGNLQKIRWIFSPRKPYFTKTRNIFKKGSGQIFEIPISAILYPYIGTTMRIFPLLTRIFRSGLYFENKLNNKPIVFLTHPNEFIDESNEQYQTQRRANNFISFLLGDVLRRRMKIKNLGIEAINLYNDQIDFFRKRNFHFVTCKEYYQINIKGEENKNAG